MASEQQLQSKLEELLESKNVYFDPPESVKMNYPAIRFTRSRIESTYANNAAYFFNDQYEITVIAKDTRHEVINKLLRLPRCKHDRHYKANGLNHDVFTLYY